MTDAVTLHPGDRVAVAPWYTRGRVEIRTGSHVVVTQARDVWIGLRLKDGFVGYFSDPLVVIGCQWEEGFLAEGAWVGGDSIVLRNGSEITIDVAAAVAEFGRRVPELFKAFGLGERSSAAVSPAAP